MMADFADDSILVLLDVTPSGELAKSAAGLLGAAASVGTPVALVVGGRDAATALAGDAAALGAAVVLTADGDASLLTVPVVDALAAAADLVRPDAILVSNSIEGRDVAGRYAARTRSGLARRRRRGVPGCGGRGRAPLRVRRGLQRGFRGDVGGAGDHGPAGRGRRARRRRSRRPVVETARGAGVRPEGGIRRLRR